MGPIEAQNSELHKQYIQETNLTNATTEPKKKKSQHSTIGLLISNTDQVFQS